MMLFLSRIVSDPQEPIRFSAFSAVDEGSSEDGRVHHDLRLPMERRKTEIMMNTTQHHVDHCRSEEQETTERVVNIIVGPRSRRPRRE